MLKYDREILEFPRQADSFFLVSSSFFKYALFFLNMGQTNAALKPISMF